MTAVEPTVHRCPPMGEGRTPCCNRTVFELPTTDQLALNDEAVTCHPEPEPNTPDHEILAKINAGITHVVGTADTWAFPCVRSGRTVVVTIGDYTGQRASIPTRSWSTCGNPECQCHAPTTTPFDGVAIAPLRRLPITLPAEIAADLPQVEPPTP